MHIKNTDTHFGLISILFHWIMAILVIGMLCLGLYMVDLADSDGKFTLFWWHKSFGVIVLTLIICRLLWRLANIVPTLAIPIWEKALTRLVHWALYLCLFLMPLSGWLMSSAANHPVSFFGWFTLPNLVNPNPEMASIFLDIHVFVAWFLIALIVLHIAGALKHHFIDRDDILKRMVSG